MCGAICNADMTTRPVLLAQSSAARAAMSGSAHHPNTTHLRIARHAHAPRSAVSRSHTAAAAAGRRRTHLHSAPSTRGRPLGNSVACPCTRLRAPDARTDVRRRPGAGRRAPKAARARTVPAVGAVGCRGAAHQLKRRLGLLFRFSCCLGLPSGFGLGLGLPSGFLGGRVRFGSGSVPRQRPSARPPRPGLALPPPWRQRRRRRRRPRVAAPP